jgi:hypothetical protein
MTTAQDTQSSLQIREIQEIAITIGAKNLNPTMLSEEFLKFSGVVPNDWVLAKQPVLGPNFSQVTFQNGVGIVAQPGVINFVESIGAQEADELKMPTIARQFVEKLPNAEYRSLSISPKSVVPFPGGEDAARQYITGTLLAPGPWQEFGTAPVQAGLNLLYQLDRCQFNVSINQAVINLPDKTAIPALLFSGNFTYNIASNSPQERVEQVAKGISDWQSDLEAFREIVNQRFLRQQETVFNVGV